MKNSKPIFLDRDGVINKDPGGWTKYSYVTNVSEFRLLPGALGAIKRLTEAGYEIIIISNQAGINKGHYTHEALEEITSLMLKEIKNAGGRVSSVNYCPHRIDENCGCRKPRIGLFKKAIHGRSINFKDTYFIGDGAMDVEAGHAVGCRTILVLSGKTELGEVDEWKIKPDYIKKDLSEAVDYILKRKRK